MFTEEDLQKLSQSNPHFYSDNNGKWKASVLEKYDHTEHRNTFSHTDHTV